MRASITDRLFTIGLLPIAAAMLVGAMEPGGDIERRLLAVHNRERAGLDVPPLRWSPRLAGDARRWADYLAASNVFAHAAPDGADRQGENLWRGTRGYFLPEEMVGAWIAEKRNFKDGEFPANSRTDRFEDVGHYTQIIWRRTSEVGCALSHGSKYDVLVCRYSSPGNVFGQRPI